MEIYKDRDYKRPGVGGGGGGENCYYCMKKTYKWHSESSPVTSPVWRRGFQEV